MNYLTKEQFLWKEEEIQNSIDYRYYVVELPLGPFQQLTQTHYHWRNDDGAEATSTSATGGSQDTILQDVLKGDTHRLRMQVSNEGTASSSAAFRLEYLEFEGSCATSTGWTDVHALGGAWDMSDSSFITNGEDTTNISVATGGVSDENTTFITPNAAVRDTTSTIPNIMVSSTAFVEMEYSIVATESALAGRGYCFRVSDAGSSINAYLEYPLAYIKSENDFKIQRGQFFVTSTSKTIVAGVDYVAPASTSSAFVRITNTHNIGAGNNTIAEVQDAQDVTVAITNPENILTSINFVRTGATDNTYVAWEIVEYIGDAGGPNEMIVRSHEYQTFVSTSLTKATGAISSVSSSEDVVVFVTGQQNPDTGNSNYNYGTVTADFNSSTEIVTLTRGETGTAIAISAAVVEFTGEHWNIQRIEHTYAFDGVFESETTTAIGDIEKAFIHVQKRTGVGQQGLDEFGHEIYISDTSTVQFQISSGANTTTEHVSVAWIIENTQNVGLKMDVTRSEGTQSGGPEPTSSSVSIGEAITDLSNSSIFMNNRSSGTGVNYPRAMIGVYLDSLTTYNIFVSDTGQTRTYRTEVVEWPAARSQYEQSSYRWFANSDSLIASSTLAAQNTTTTLSDVGQEFRLRLLLQNDDKIRTVSTKNLKLQFASSTSQCDVDFVGETFIDVTTSTDIAFFENVSVTDGTQATSSVNDPTNGSTVELQSYVESNTFTNSSTVLSIGESGLWDFSLYDNGAAPSSTFCFRVVESDNTLLETYTHIPEIITAEAELTIDIVDSGGVSIADPSIKMATSSVDLSCQQATGTFGESDERLRINNTTANAQWSVSIAATLGPTSTWTTGSLSYDFNDGGGTPVGCTDTGDTDSEAGQMSVDPSVSSITPEGGCATTGLSLGSQASFAEGVTDSIGLITAGATADVGCFWDMTDIDVTQQIPEGQESGEYTIDMTVTIVSI